MSEGLSSRHQSELHAVQEANQLAVGALRGRLEQLGREELARVATEHREEMGEIRGNSLVLQGMCHRVTAVMVSLLIEE